MLIGYLTTGNQRMTPQLYSSLLAKFMLAAALPLLLLLIFANIAYVYFKADELRGRHLADVKGEVHLLATQLSIPVWQFDRKTVESLVHTLKESPYITCATLDEYESHSKKIRQSTTVGDCDLITNDEAESISVDVSYDYEGDIVNVGLLEAKVDLSKVSDSLVSALLNELVLFVFYVLIFLVGFTVALKTTVLKPLQMVRTSIKSYQDTGKRELVEWTTKDELGTLIKEYNKNLIGMDEAEQALLDKNIILEEARLEAEEARDVAERTAKAKSEFLANMSHEIRTPMNAVQGLSEMMSRTRLDVKQAGYLHRIRNSADILLAIINDILDFSKIEAGKLELENVEFALDDVIERVADVESFVAGNKGLDIIIKVSPDIPCRLQGDAMRFSQVLINLISNAIKFTETGEIVVALELVSHESEKIIINSVVTDTGVGIAETALLTLFDSFTQADGSTTRKFGGTGLGLTISKRLVELMGGDISVKSKEGRGSEFSFTAEFSTSPVIEQGNTAGSLVKALGGERPNIVIVGDSRSCDELSHILSQFSLSITRIKSGVEAVAHLRSLACNVVDTLSKVVIYVDIDSVRVSLSEFIEQIDLSSASTVFRLVPVLSIKQRDDIGVDIDSLYVNTFITKPVLRRRTINSLIDAFVLQPESTDQNFGLNTPRNNLKGACILVVEDNQVNQLVAREMLESEGVVVRVADNGEQALIRLEDKSVMYDAILMDVHMPVMDGYGATKAIREKYGDKLPIIALTANATTQEEKHCRSIGMSDFLTKPIESERLFKVLSHWVGESQRETGRVPVDVGKEVVANTSEVTGDVSGSDELLISMPDLEVRFKAIPAVIPRIFKSFEESFRDFEVQFMDAHELSDVDEMYRLAHSLKGSAANISAEKLRLLSGDLEEKLKSHQQIEAMEWFPWVVDHLSKVLVFIDEYLKNEDNL